MAIQYTIECLGRIALGKNGNGDTGSSVEEMNYLKAKETVHIHTENVTVLHLSPRVFDGMAA